MTSAAHDTTPVTTPSTTGPELGLDTFGDVTVDADGTRCPTTR